MTEKERLNQIAKAVIGAAIQVHCVLGAGDMHVKNSRVGKPFLGSAYVMTPCVGMYAPLRIGRRRDAKLRHVCATLPCAGTCSRC